MIMFFIFTLNILSMILIYLHGYERGKKTILGQINNREIIEIEVKFFSVQEVNS